MSIIACSFPFILLSVTASALYPHHRAGYFHQFVQPDGTTAPDATSPAHCCRKHDIGYHRLDEHSLQPSAHIERPESSSERTACSVPYCRGLQCCLTSLVYCSDAPRSVSVCVSVCVYVCLCMSVYVCLCKLLLEESTGRKNS